MKSCRFIAKLVSILSGRRFVLLYGPKGGTPFYGLYRYVVCVAQRVWFFSRFGHK